MNEIVEKSACELRAMIAGKTLSPVEVFDAFSARIAAVERRRDGSSVMYRVVDPNFVDICRTVSITVASRDLGDQLGVAAVKSCD